MGDLIKVPLGPIRPCQAPVCDIATNKRYHRDGVVVVVACCPKHAESALARHGVPIPSGRHLVAVAA